LQQLLGWSVSGRGNKAVEFLNEMLGTGQHLGRLKEKGESK
jgi:hypothetical protein